MGKYIHLFETNAEFKAMYNDDEKYIEPWASYTREAERCDYNKPNFLAKPLKMEFLDDTTIYFNSTNYSYEDVKLSKNGGEWVSATAYTEESPLSISAGDTLEWVGDYEGYFVYDSYWGEYSPRLNMNVASAGDASASWAPRVKLSGNIMSLINSTGFSEVFDFTQPRVFAGSSSSFIFESFSLADISGLVLPATGLTDYCYASLFNRNNGSFIDTFTTAPELPATTLAQSCYFEMFNGCTSLTTAPALPATTLTEECYYCMFAGCTSLTQAPVLPATTLANYCYEYMFSHCSNLASLTVLVTDFTNEYWASDCMSGVLSNAGTNATEPVLYCANADAVAAFTAKRGDVGVGENWTIQVAQ